MYKTIATRDETTLSPIVRLVGWFHRMVMPDEIDEVLANKIPKWVRYWIDDATRIPKAQYLGVQHEAVIDIRAPHPWDNLVTSGRHGELKGMLTPILLKWACEAGLADYYKAFIVGGPPRLENKGFFEKLRENREKQKLFSDQEALKVLVRIVTLAEDPKANFNKIGFIQDFCSAARDYDGGPGKNCGAQEELQMKNTLINAKFGRYSKGAILALPLIMQAIDQYLERIVEKAMADQGMTSEIRRSHGDFVDRLKVTDSVTVGSVRVQIFIEHLAVSIRDFINEFFESDQEARRAVLRELSSEIPCANLLIDDENEFGRAWLLVGKRWRGDEGKYLYPPVSEILKWLANFGVVALGEGFGRNRDYSHLSDLLAIVQTQNNSEVAEFYREFQTLGFVNGNPLLWAVSTQDKRMVQAIIRLMNQLSSPEFKVDEPVFHALLDQAVKRNEQEIVIALCDVSEYWPFTISYLERICHLPTGERKAKGLLLFDQASWLQKPVDSRLIRIKQEMMETKQQRPTNISTATRFMLHPPPPAPPAPAEIHRILIAGLVENDQPQVDRQLQALLARNIRLNTEQFDTEFRRDERLTDYQLLRIATFMQQHGLWDLDRILPLLLNAYAGDTYAVSGFVKKMERMERLNLVPRGRLKEQYLAAIRSLTTTRYEDILSLTPRLLDLGEMLTDHDRQTLHEKISEVVVWEAEHCVQHPSVTPKIYQKVFNSIPREVRLKILATAYGRVCILSIGQSARRYYPSGKPSDIYFTQLNDAMFRATEGEKEATNHQLKETLIPWVRSVVPAQNQDVSEASMESMLLLLLLFTEPTEPMPDYKKVLIQLERFALTPPDTVLFDFLHLITISTYRNKKSVLDYAIAACAPRGQQHHAISLTPPQQQLIENLLIHVSISDGVDQFLKIMKQIETTNLFPRNRLKTIYFQVFHLRSEQNNYGDLPALAQAILALEELLTDNEQQELTDALSRAVVWEAENKVKMSSVPRSICHSDVIPRIIPRERWVKVLLLAIERICAQTPINLPHQTGLLQNYLKLINDAMAVAPEEECNEIRVLLKNALMTLVNPAFAAPNSGVAAFSLESLLLMLVLIADPKKKILGQEKILKPLNPLFLRPIEMVRLELLHLLTVSTYPNKKEVLDCAIVWLNVQGKTDTRIQLTPQQRQVIENLVSSVAANYGVAQFETYSIHETLDQVLIVLNTDPARRTAILLRGVMDWLDRNGGTLEGVTSCMVLLIRTASFKSEELQLIARVISRLFIELAPQFSFVRTADLGQFDRILEFYQFCIHNKLAGPNPEIFRPALDALQVADIAIQDLDRLRRYLALADQDPILDQTIPGIIAVSFQTLIERLPGRYQVLEEQSRTIQALVKMSQDFPQFSTVAQLSPLLAQWLQRQLNSCRGGGVSTVPFNRGRAIEGSRRPVYRANSPANQYRQTLFPVLDGPSQPYEIRHLVQTLANLLTFFNQNGVRFPLNTELKKQIYHAVGLLQGLDFVTGVSLDPFVSFFNLNRDEFRRMELSEEIVRNWGEVFFRSNLVLPENEYGDGPEICLDFASLGKTYPCTHGGAGGSSEWRNPPHYPGLQKAVRENFQLLDEAIEQGKGRVIRFSNLLSISPTFFDYCEIILMQCMRQSGADVLKTIACLPISIPIIALKVALDLTLFCLSDRIPGSLFQLKNQPDCDTFLLLIDGLQERRISIDPLMPRIRELLTPDILDHCCARDRARLEVLLGHA